MDYKTTGCPWLNSKKNTSGREWLWETAVKFSCPGLCITSPDHLVKFDVQCYKPRGFYFFFCVLKRKKGKDLVDYMKNKYGEENVSEKIVRSVPRNLNAFLREFMRMRVEWCNIMLIFSAECTIGMVMGLTPLKHYGTMALWHYGTMEIRCKL